MRSEAEIRKAVETRLKRWGLLLVNGGLWAAVVFVLSQIMPNAGISSGWRGFFSVLMLVWTPVLGLHILSVLYVELREYLVRRAVGRERELYLMRENDDKRKRDRAVSRLELGEDGELVDFPMSEDTNYERRN
jgi:hypothetical protein